MFRSEDREELKHKDKYGMCSHESALIFRESEPKGLKLSVYPHSVFKRVQNPKGLKKILRKYVRARKLGGMKELRHSGVM